MKISTIKLRKDTKARIDKLKVHKRESYEEAITRILAILNTCKNNPYDARIKLKKIDNLRRKLKE